MMIYMEKYTDINIQFYIVYVIRLFNQTFFIVLLLSS